MNRVGPTTTLALIAAGTAAVLALWWHSTRSIVGPGGALTTLGKDRSILPLGKVYLSKWIYNGRSTQITAVRSAPDRSG